MTQYVVDGEVGSMTASQEDPSANMHTSIDYVLRMNAEQEISLTNPTQLDFGELTWKIRFPDTYTRAFRDKGLKELQPDALIDGWTGYARSGSWFVYQEQDDEWFEAHGGIDGAWWQFLFQGRNRALFTDGTSSQEVELSAGQWYYVSLVFGGGIVTTRLSDGENTLASFWSFVSVSLSGKSYLGASALVYAVSGGSEYVQFYHPDDNSQPPMPDELSPITDNDLIYYGSDEDQDVFGESVAMNSQGTGGTGGGFTTNVGQDVKTGDLGTCSGVTAVDHVRRAYWAVCGRLEYHFNDHRTTNPWYRFMVMRIPEAYKNDLGYLEWQPYINPRYKELNDYPEAPGAMGQGIEGRSIPKRWPISFQDGYNGGLHVIDTIGVWQHIGPFYAPTNTMEEGQWLMLGLEITPSSRAEFPPWYICGNGFQWPWRTGTGNSWRSYHGSPHSWIYRWVLNPLPPGNPTLEVDDIVFDADFEQDDDGGIITEDSEIMEGWNTEMVPVENGQFVIEATPVRGSVNVYTWDGQLLDYGDDWEEADDLGLTYDLHAKVEGDAVTVIYFVTRPVLGNEPAISRPTQEIGYQETPRKTRTPFPM